MYAFRLCRTFSQLARIQNGSVNVVSSTKYNEIPSIPNRSEKKEVLLSSVTNWYVSQLESNSLHMIIDRTKVISVITRVVFLIREVPVGVVSDIVVIIRAPTIGNRKMVISMFFYGFYPCILREI